MPGAAESLDTDTPVVLLVLIRRILFMRFVEAYGEQVSAKALDL